MCKDGNTKSDQCFKYLVKNAEVYGIDLNVTDSFGRTPFLSSCCSNNIRLIQLWFDTPFEFTPDSFRLVGYTYRNGVTELYSPGRNLAFDWYNTEESTWHDVSEVDKIFRKDELFFCAWTSRFAVYFCKKESEGISCLRILTQNKRIF